MKNVKNNSCLADFENELENLNHSEMKELVGGAESYSGIGGGGGCETMTVIGYYSGNNFGGYNSYSAFLSSYTSSSPVTSSATSGAGSSGGSSSTSALTPKEIKCRDEFDARVKDASSIYNAAFGIGNYVGLVTIAGRRLADCIRQ